MARKSCCVPLHMWDRRAFSEFRKSLLQTFGGAGGETARCLHLRLVCVSGLTKLQAMLWLREGKKMGSSLPNVDFRVCSGILMSPHAGMNQP